MVVRPSDYTVYVRFGESDFSRFSPSIYDFRRTRSIGPYHAGSDPALAERITISDQAPGTPFIAWVDNTLGPGYPRINLLAEASPQVVYEPSYGYEGTDSFTYTVQNDRGEVSNLATVTISVSESNLPPTVANDSAATPLDTPVTIEVLANDSFVATNLTASPLVIKSPPAHGTAAIQQTTDSWTVVYTPAPGYVGTDAFQYALRDINGNVSNTATVTINPPPTAQDHTTSTAENTPVAVDVLEGATEPDGTLDPATLAITGGPTRGTVTLRQDYLATDDNSSPIGNGFASGLSGTVGSNGQISLAVTGAADTAFSGAHTRWAVTPYMSDWERPTSRIFRRACSTFNSHEP